MPGPRSQMAAGYNSADGKIYLNGGYADSTRGSTPFRRRPGATTPPRTRSPCSPPAPTRTEDQPRGRQRPFPGRRRPNDDPRRDAGRDLGLRHRVRYVDSEAGHAAADERAGLSGCARSALGDRRVYSDSVQSVRRTVRGRELRSGREHVVGRSEPQSRAIVPRGCSGRRRARTPWAAATALDVSLDTVEKLDVGRRRLRRRRHLRLHRLRHPASATSASTSSASATSATSATSASATSATSAATAAVRCRVPRVIGLRLKTAKTQDPQGTLLVGASAALARGDAARPRHRPEPEARHDQAPGLPGQDGGRSALDRRHEHKRAVLGAALSAWWASSPLRAAADPLLAARVELLLPERHLRLERLDRVGACRQRVLPVRRRDGDRDARLADLDAPEAV